MKHTEEQIVEKAKIVMKDLRGKLYLEGCVDGAFFKEKHNIISGKNEGKVMATWSVSIKAVFDNIDFLTISDETGEPLCYQNFNTYIFDVEKDKRGYFRVGLPRN